MEIPRKFLITVELGKACATGRKMLAYNVDVSAIKHCYLAVFIMCAPCLRVGPRAA